MLDDQAMAYVESCQEELGALLWTLCGIPAPSGREERRAAFIEGWLHDAGARGAFIDGAGNVILPLGDDAGPVTLFMAHTDTVFPDLEPMPRRVEDGVMYCPGVGDDTASVVVLMLVARYAAQRNLRPAQGALVFAFNTCEEGLGNLKGCRALMDRYGVRTQAVVSLDSTLGGLCDRSVGSERYRITARTEGGHSYAAFGNRNAIHALSELVCALYAQRVPEGGRTTYNVGVIEGGTSVNAIAQEASMLYEYRSDERRCLEAMRASLRARVEAMRVDGLDLTVELIGERPCMGEVDPERQRALVRRCADAVERAAGERPRASAGSTDCNVPLSMGIPAVCMGAYVGGGAHTRGEWVRLDSLPLGLRAALDVALGFLNGMEA